MQYSNVTDVSDVNGHPLQGLEARAYRFRVQLAEQLVELCQTHPGSSMFHLYFMMKQDVITRRADRGSDFDEIVPLRNEVAQPLLDPCEAWFQFGLMEAWRNFSGRPIGSARPVMQIFLTDGGGTGHFARLEALLWTPAHGVEISSWLRHPVARGIWFSVPHSEAFGLDYIEPDDVEERVWSITEHLVETSEDLAHTKFRRSVEGSLIQPYQPTGGVPIS